MRVRGRREGSRERARVCVRVCACVHLSALSSRALPPGECTELLSWWVGEPASRPQGPPLRESPVLSQLGPSPTPPPDASGDTLQTYLIASSQGIFFPFSYIYSYYRSCTFFTLNFIS